VSQEPYVSDGAVLCIIYPPVKNQIFITKNLEIMPENIFEQVLFLAIFYKNEKFSKNPCYLLLED
jgi:hypothetical protein